MRHVLLETEAGLGGLSLFACDQLLERRGHVECGLPLLHVGRKKFSININILKHSLLCRFIIPICLPL